MSINQPPILRNKFIGTMIGIILVLLALYLLKKVDYLYKPLVAALTYLLTPVLLSLFLYYILRPLVRLLTRLVRVQSLAILIAFLLLFLLIVAIVLLSGNIIQTQIKDLTHTFANYYEKIRDSINSGKNPNLARLAAQLRIEEKLGTLTERLFVAVQHNLFGFFSTLTSIGTILVLIPFILFYFLKDDRGIFGSIKALFPTNFRAGIANIIRNADKTLAMYMQGQLIIALMLGALTYLGYLIIGLPNSFLLALITMITMFIPMFGSLIGMIPAALVGLTISPFLFSKVLIVLVIVHQLEGNLISPRLQGERMHIHPLMVLFVVISSYILFGILGSLFAVPIYAVLRVVVKTYLAEKWLNVGK